MALQKVNLAFFSATGTTAKIVSAIGSGLGINRTHTINLANPNPETLTISNDEIIVFGVPVYSGRIPDMARRAIEKIKGDNTPAIVACVYGNRDFDDALLELKELAENNGFHVLSAGAFIAQHSIFPDVAKGRPDENDLKQAREFGTNSLQALAQTEGGALTVKGNHPYRATKPVPLTPKTNGNCNLCGLCARQCPAQAIDLDNPKKIDKDKCISCAHCIAICPKDAKKFGGLLYWIASKKFTKKYRQRKEGYWVYR